MRATLNRLDEASVVWFFGIGQTVFQRSCFGPMLDRVILDSFASVQCNGCDGSGILVNGDWCPRCNGVGCVPAKRPKPTEPITARPRGNEHHESGYVPEDWQLERYAVVSRRLGRMSGHDPAAPRVFEAYYGDLGERWEHSGWGRIFALYPMTTAGQKLLGVSTGLGVLTPTERLASQAEVNNTQPKRERTRLLSRANDQARDLHTAAVVLWNEVGR